MEILEQKALVKLALHPLNITEHPESQPINLFPIDRIINPEESPDTAVDRVKFDL